MSAIGIFAGTFDPVHEGHVEFALKALSDCGLETVYFLPEHQPRNKQNVTDFKERLDLLKQMIKPYPRLQVLTLPETNFTVVETIPKLEKRFPGAELNFMMGSDAGRRLPDWPGIKEVLPRVRLIIGLRAGDNATELKSFLEQELPLARTTIIASPKPHVSSTQLRKRQSA